MTKRFELQDGKSQKYWEIKTSGKKTLVRYGRIGSDGRVVETTHDSPTAAKTAAEKLITQKTKRGYQAVAAGKKNSAAKETAKSVTNKTAVKKKAKTTAKATVKKRAAKKSVTQVDKKPSPKPKVGEVVDVTGILEASNPGGVKSQGEKWTFCTGFQVWKYTKSEMIEGPITILESNIGERRLTNQMSKFNPWKIRRLRLKMVKQRGRKELVGELVKDLGAAHDAELSRLVRELQKPMIVKDPEFGKFEFDRGYSCYEANSKWMGQQVSLSIDVPSQFEYEKGLQAARKLWKKQKTLDNQLRKYACAELLENANDWIAQSDEPNKKRITASDFKKRMQLTSVSIGSDGDFTFWFDDDEMFWGHVITVGGKAD